MADLTFITDRVATGAMITTDDDIKSLVAQGITHVIDCREEFDDAPLFALYPAIFYLWNGVPDDGQPKPASWFAKSIQFALPGLANPNSRVFAHCAGGMNRGPSTAFAIMLALGFPADIAEQLMRSKRPQVTLAYKNDAIAAVPALGY